MRFVTCGAMTKQGIPCKSLVEAAGKRCHYHGGLSTGARTAAGKLANGLRLLAVKANGPPRGTKHTGKAKRRRETSAKRLQAWRDREPIRRKKRLRWQNRQRAKAGLPLLTEAELDSFTCDPVEGQQE